MVTRIKIFILFIGVSFTGFSQELNCGSEPTKKDIEALRKLDVQSYLNGRVSVAAPIKIAVSAHIVRRSDGTGGLTEQELTDAIADVNTIYTLTNMEFFIFGDINYIDNDDYFDFNSSQEVELASENFVENTINVYFFNSAVSGETAVCGYARFPQSGIDRVIMVNDCTTNGSTFPHELGHYFALYHTHGTTNTGTTDEFVTRDEGANCDTAGDELCDTAADPNLSGLVDGSCAYIGTGTDANGDTFEPNPRNLMSYSQKHCRDEFSQGQADRISAAYQEYKTYIYSKNFAANFDVATRELCEGASVDFINESVNAVSHAWTFEGGTPASSTDINPSVTYTTAGSYDVILEITEAGGDTHAKTLENYITVKDVVSSEIIANAGSFEEEGLAEAVYNDDESTTWEQTSAAFTDGTGSVFMDFYSYGNAGAEDYLVAGVLNTSEEKVFALTFDYAYAAYDDEYYDGLEIVYRDPCGEWLSAWYKESDELATAPDQENPFTPTSEDWKTETVLFEIDESVEVVEFAFKGVNGYGNNLYLDNYNVAPFDPSFTISNIEVTNTSCPDIADGSLSVTLSNEGAYEYSIDGETFDDSSEIINLLPGTYTVTARNVIGTEESQEVEVGYENDYPDVPVISLDGDNLVVTLDEGQTVQWYLEGQVIAGATESALAFEEAGSYTVYVSNGGCSTASDAFIVLSAEVVDSNLRIFPNPVKQYLTIELPVHLQNDVERITISDLSGRKIQTYDFNSQLDVSTLKSGIYILNFELDGEKVNRRFLKQ